MEIAIMLKEERDDEEKIPFIDFNCFDLIINRL